MRPGIPSIVGTATVLMLVAASPALSYPRPVASVQVDAAPRALAPTENAMNTSVSASGRFVAFDSESKLLEGDTNVGTDVYLRDMKTGKLWLASSGSSGQSAAGVALYRPPGMAGWGQDFFEKPVPLSWDPALSGNGRSVAFISQAVNIVPGDTNIAPDIFLFDRKDRSVERVSVDSEGKEGGPLNADVLPESWGPSTDGTGRRIAFTTKASFEESDDNFASDIYVRDRKTDKTELATIGVDGKAASDACLELPVLGKVPSCPTYFTSPLSTGAAISADGRHVVFQSAATNLVDEDTNGSIDVFVRDLAKDRTERISVTSAGDQVGDANNPAGFTIEVTTSSLTVEDFSRVEHAISADGRFVVFSSRSDELVPADTSALAINGDHDYFVHDRKTGRIERVNVSSSGAEASFTTGDHEVAAISGDGRFVVFSGNMNPDLAPAGSPRGSAMWVYDRMAGSLELTSRTTEGKIGRGCRIEATPDDETWGAVDAPDVSSDGRFVTYRTCNSNMYDYPDRDFNNHHVILTDRGLVVGAGGLGPSPNNDGPAPEQICIVAEICIDPMGWVERMDHVDGGGSLPFGADLVGARVAYRPIYEDLFITQELRRLPFISPTTGQLRGLDRVLYGIRFRVMDRRFEVRMVSAGGGTFGLFDCGSGSVTCRQIAELDGGFGTTGERIVFSLPLELVGLDRGGSFSDVEAYTAIGGFLSGPAHIEDVVSIPAR